MKRKRFSEEQIIAVLREHEAGAKTGDLARKYGVSEATLYNWEAKYGGLDISEANASAGRRGNLPVSAWGRPHVGEPMVVGKVGLGARLYLAGQFLETEQVFAVLIVLALLEILITKLQDAIDRRLSHWQVS
jgi:hypothetical protein